MIMVGPTVCEAFRRCLSGFGVRTALPYCEETVTTAIVMDQDATFETCLHDDEGVSYDTVSVRS
jgi:hypothetical protein